MTINLDDVFQKRMITVSIMLATIMQVLDTTIANVALPHIQGSLNTTQEQVAWVLTSYIVAAAIMTAPVGFMAARVGRKQLLLLSVVGFSFFSALCGASTGLPEMIVFRVLQGVCGAALVPLSQAVLLDINTREEHGKAMAMWGMGIMLGPILGPTLGGWITEYYSWRWVFYINVPVGIAAFMGIWLFMPESDKRRDRKFDLFGFVLLGLAIGALQLMLDRGQNQDWFSSAEVIAEAVFAALMFYLFVVHILTAKSHPFIEPAMFKDRNYTVSITLMFVVGLVLLASMALSPPFLQNLKGYPVLLTGYVLAPRGFGVMIAMAVVGKVLTGRVDARWMILFGLALTSYSLHMMSRFNLDVPESLLIWTGVIQGFGLGFVFVPLSTVAYSTLEPHYRDDATAIFSLSRNIGSSIGISLVMALLVNNIQVSHADLVSTLPNFGDKERVITGAISKIGHMGTDEGLALLNQMVTVQAAAIAYINDFLLMMYIVMISIPLVLLLGAGGKTSPSAPIPRD